MEFGISSFYTFELNTAMQASQYYRETRRVSHIEQELCIALYIVFSPFVLVIALSVLRLMASDYLFGIFIFLGISNSDYITTFDQVMMTLNYEIYQVQVPKVHNNIS
jgi:hypothetical protein